LGSVKTDLPTPATDPDLVITKGTGGGELAAAAGDGAAPVLPDEPQAVDPPIASRRKSAGASIVFVFMPLHYRSGLREVDGRLREASRLQVFPLIRAVSQQSHVNSPSVSGDLTIVWGRWALRDAELHRYFCELRR